MSSSRPQGPGEGLGGGVLDLRFEALKDGQDWVVGMEHGWGEYFQQRKQLEHRHKNGERGRVSFDRKLSWEQGDTQARSGGDQNAWWRNSD